MDTQLLSPPNLGHLLQAMAHLVKLPSHRLWVDYDAAADVVYLHFTERPASTHSEMSAEGFLLDYNEEDEVVGLTILAASQR